MSLGDTMTAGGVPDQLRADLAAEPDGVLETLARKHGVPMETVFSALPAGSAVAAPGTAFEEIWADLATWGTIMFIVHTQDGVFETKGVLPPGTSGRGYFNIHGDSPIGGHLKADRCKAIRFIDRPFFKRRSLSVQFVSVDGEVMFKVFVGRDENRELNPDQIGRFEALRARFAA